MLKPDEERIRLLLSEYLSLDIIPVEHDPPDCCLQINGNNILLEITSIHDIFVEESSAIGNRKTISNSISDLLEKLNDKYLSLVPVDISFCFHINGPIENFRVFKNSLDMFIDYLINNYMNYSLNKFIIHDFNGEQFRFIVTNRRTKAIWGFIGCKPENTVYCLDDQAELCLKSAINDKNKKMKDITGIKWLAIDCKQVLSDYFLCKKTVEKINDLGCFEKIFLIFDNEIIEKSVD